VTLPACYTSGPIRYGLNVCLWCDVSELFRDDGEGDLGSLTLAVRMRLVPGMHT
jgi:hypothetical protein